jgi:GNAT superfamily N-acetyltransferase
MLPKRFADRQSFFGLDSERHRDGFDRIVAAGSYISRGGGSAEISMGVDDRLQGMGLGTHLLERLAAIAIQNGFRRFQAVAEKENHRMIEVFRRSGFPVHERTDSEPLNSQLLSAFLTPEGRGLRREPGPRLTPFPALP